ncbi:SLC13 family permease [Desulfuromonas versatilis]|uniref:SLC13 family permease n=1 Tax=Desulfuromonas versatilis TaxID=2802975 RepID=A0ABM8HRF7_9BACT|nr:SLC13 family permease [Desulfuromonas versatilis]BCR03147.1 SLC13 family permease [Desulfuromonas versatilis]
MTQDQTIIFAILAATIGLFLWGRWRHDVVALASLLACVFAGLVPVESAFVSLGHPAVITVACVLVLSSGLQATGAVDAFAQRLLPQSAGLLPSMAALIGLGALLSAFMNNVGAMALLMPVAIQVASKHEIPPGRVLMPLAFGTILGGMTTLIGTPPNLIVSGFRAEIGVGSFGMFDFSPVGLAVVAVGAAFIVLLGWRLVPVRQEASGMSFDTGTYFTEVRITAKAKAVGKTLREFEQGMEEADAQVVGMVRNDFRVSAPNPARVLREGDILVIEADPEALSGVLSNHDLELAEDVRVAAEDAEKQGGTPDPEVKADDAKKDFQAHEVELLELVVMINSGLAGRSASDIQLRTRFGLNLLAISRQGRRSIKRLRTASLQAGDVLLMQGAQEALSGFAATFNCVPLAARSISIPDKGRASIATAVMIAAIGGAALGLVPAALSFAAGVLVFMLLRIVPPRKVYEAVDWPVIVLLGALIPVAGAMETTGAADLLARNLLENIAQGHPVAALALILIVTMTLSDFMNNAATAAVMCPIAISTAAQLGLNADTFLMAVAIGASCAFLTPIGHQNNTLILGPGGFRFGDYWRLGLPMEILVVGVSLPMLLWIWPLG